jgi:hypothetical protein
LLTGQTRLNPKKSPSFFIISLSSSMLMRSWPLQTEIQIPWSSSLKRIEYKKIIQRAFLSSMAKACWHGTISYRYSIHTQSMLAH